MPCLYELDSLRTSTTSAALFLLLVAAWSTATALAGFLLGDGDGAIGSLRILLGVGTSPLERLDWHYPQNDVCTGYLAFSIQATRL